MAGAVADDGTGTGIFEPAIHGNSSFQRHYEGITGKLLHLNGRQWLWCFGAWRTPTESTGSVRCEVQSKQPNHMHLTPCGVVDQKQKASASPKCSFLLGILSLAVQLLTISFLITSLLLFACSIIPRSEPWSRKFTSPTTKYVHFPEVMLWR